MAKTTVALILMSLSSPLTWADDAEISSRPLALIWTGDGACKPGCVDSAKRVANKAGFRFRTISERPTSYTMFKEAKLWIQPGGIAVTAANAMGPKLMTEVREFIAGGGGYVGFCAGAFLATELIGSTEFEGFGIVPGSTTVMRPGNGSHDMLKITGTVHKPRWIYFAGGPYLTIAPEQLAAQKAEFTAWYPNGAPASYQGTYGFGKVSITGLHPEADALWKWWKKQKDVDGSDEFIAVNMISWATAVTPPEQVQEQEQETEVVPPTEATIIVEETNSEQEISPSSEGR